jgi:predicted small secreted protein
MGETGSMNPHIRSLLLVLLLALETLIVTGCANTARGIKSDYHHNEDKVEDAVKR